jgi:hypothetical protein
MKAYIVYHADRPEHKRLGFGAGGILVAMVWTCKNPDHPLHFKKTPDGYVIVEEVDASKGLISAVEMTLSISPESSVPENAGLAFIAPFSNEIAAILGK